MKVASREQAAGFAGWLLSGIQQTVITRAYPAARGKNMYQGDELNNEECGHLARILLAARRVNQRHQFFSWVHGPLQSLIPHEIMLCGVGDDGGYMLHERFSACRYFRDEHFHRTIQPGSGLIAQLSHEWIREGIPHFIAPVRGDPWLARLTELELKNLAFHGMGWLNGQLKGYVALARVRIPFDDRLALYLDILLPHLLTTLARVLACEARAQTQGGRPGCLVTGREVEVLLWVRDGKTNDEIADILGLSMLTVKNHLRHAMKKLAVRTRGQAVAKVIALGLLQAQGPRAGD
jgi:transcriptional regulator EpsA